MALVSGHRGAWGSGKLPDLVVWETAGDGLDSNLETGEAGGFSVTCPNSPTLFYDELSSAPPLCPHLRIANNSQHFFTPL